MSAFNYVSNKILNKAFQLSLDQNNTLTVAGYFFDLLLASQVTLKLLSSYSQKRDSPNASVEVDLGRIELLVSDDSHPTSRALNNSRACCG